MFDRLLQVPRMTKRQWDGPLAEDRCRYLAHCAAQQMTRGSLRGIAINTLVIAKTLRLAARPEELITLREIEAGADRYVSLANRRRQPSRPEKRRGGHLWQAFRRCAIRWPRFLGRLPPPLPIPRSYAERTEKRALSAPVVSTTRASREGQPASDRHTAVDGPKRASAVEYDIVPD